MRKKRKHKYTVYVHRPRTREREKEEEREREVKQRQIGKQEKKRERGCQRMTAEKKLKILKYFEVWDKCCYNDYRNTVYRFGTLTSVMIIIPLIFLGGNEVGREVRFLNVSFCRNMLRWSVYRRSCLANVSSLIVYCLDDDCNASSDFISHGESSPVSLRKSLQVIMGDIQEVVAVFLKMHSMSEWWLYDLKFRMTHCFRE